MRIEREHALDRLPRARRAGEDERAAARVRRDGGVSKNAARRKLRELGAAQGARAAKRDRGGHGDVRVHS